MLLVAFVLAAPRQMQAGGTWSPLAHAPPAGLNNCLIMSDGTVLCGDGGSGWYRLVPDGHGSYLNGTWTNAAATKYSRLFYSSQVLTNGNMYVAGGEYGTGRGHAELYDSQNNTWSSVPQPASDPQYSDAISKMLPGGIVLQGTTGGGCWLYNPTLNTITAAAGARNQNEACWVRLANDCVLTVDAFGTQSEHYVPSANLWVNDNTVPVSLYGYGGEMGAGFTLPNSNVFYIGGTTHTAIYTPGATPTTAGTWVAGPEMIFGTNGLGAVDAPAAMMMNGKILCALGQTNGFNGPTYFYEYDYLSNSFTQVAAPVGSSLGSAPFVMTMTQLPDGNILFVSGQGSTQLYIYFPDGSPLAAGKPVISSITENTDGSYHMTGTGFNGLTGGGAYGDDWQMDSNYPLVRLTNSVSGNVYYARTYGWNSTGVLTGSKVITTEFSLPVGLPAGTYTLVVVANGNPSLPQTFTYTPLAGPTGLNAGIGSGQLRLAWNPVAGATAYNVKRSTISGAYYTTIATVTGTNYTNTGLTNGVNYYYVVNVVNSGGPGTYSAQLAASPFGTSPTPTGLVAGPDSYLGISVAWNPAVGATSYNVKRSTGGAYSTIATRTNPNYNDTNVLNGTTYNYEVSALSAAGESANSSPVSATATNANDVTAGLVANWRLDDLAGSTAADSSGNANTGTLVNSPTWSVPGRIGASALSVVDTNLQYVTVANAASLDMTAGITIAAWINPTDWASNRRILQKGNSDNQYRFLAENGVLKFHLNGVNTLTCALPPTNVWSHIAATYNGSTMVIYINGLAQATLAASGAISTTSDPLTIATKNGSTSTGDYFKGLLDEVRVYNHGLSQPEIFTVMHNGDTPPTVPTGVAAVPGNAQASLYWTAVSGASSYNVRRSTTSGGPYTTVGTAFAAAYNDTGLTNGVTYYYVVSAVNGATETVNSTQVSALPGIGVTFFTDVNYGGAGTRLLAAGSYTLAQLQSAGIANDAASSCRIPPGWTATVYQNDSYAGQVWTLISDSPDFSTFSQMNDNMSSCKITSAAGPAIPSGLIASATNSQVNLSWNTSSGATSYNVKRSTTNGGPYTIIASTTLPNYPDTGVINGTNYYYVVTAVNLAGESGNSSQATSTPGIPPAAPTGLIATGTNSQVNLVWNASSGASYYNVKRSQTDGGPYNLVATAGGTSYPDGGLANGTPYYYVVTAVGPGGESTNSPQASATPVAPPAMPTGLTATPTNALVNLAWNASASAASYNVKRSLSNGGPYSLIATSATTNYPDAGLANGMPYYYVVSAVNAGGESADSAQASATPVAPPLAPAGLTATAGDLQAFLSWSASAGAAGYNLKRSTITGGPYAIVASPTGTNFADIGLTNGTTYYYVVSATSIGGESANSSEASVTPVSPQIVLIVGPQTNGQFSFHFQGTDGTNYVVLLSTNLVNWLPVLTNQPVGGLFNYTDTNLTDPARFYRVKQ
jgi:fibronectin type 3 domain-containing protein